MNIRLYYPIGGSGAGPRKAGPRWGRSLCRLATILAISIAAVAIATTPYNVAANEPVVPVFALVLAAAIWLAGRFCRFLLTDY